MSYVFSNIFWCLLLAGLFGGLIGWLIKHFGGSGQLAELESTWQGKFSGVESERDRLSATARETDDKLRSLQAKFANVEGELSTLHAASLAWDKLRSKQASDLKAFAEERTSLEAKVTELSAEAASWQRKAVDCGAMIGDLENRLQLTIAEDKADDAAYEKQIAELKLTLDTTTRQQVESESNWASRFASLEGERNSLRNRLASAQQSLDKAIADDKADDTVYQQQIAGLQAELAAYAQQRTALTNERDSIRTQLAGLTATSNEQIADLKRQLDLAGQRLEKAVAADKADDAAYQKEIADLKGQLAPAEKRFEEAVASDKAGNAAYENRIAQLEGNLTEATRLAATMVTAADHEALMKRLADAEAQPKKSAAAAGDIERIEGIGPAYGQKLRAAGIAWVRELLARGADPEGRLQIVAQTGLKAELILTWVNAADLLRVDGVTPDWAELLEASGVDTVKELRNRVPENLLQKLTETNPHGPGGRYAPTLPELDEVASWVAQAKGMRPRVTH